MLKMSHFFFCWLCPYGTLTLEFCEAVRNFPPRNTTLWKNILFFSQKHVLKASVVKKRHLVCKRRKLVSSNTSVFKDTLFLVHDAIIKSNNNNSSHPSNACPLLDTVLSTSFVSPHWIQWHWGECYHIACLYRFWNSSQCHEIMPPGLGAGGAAREPHPGACALDPHFFCLLMTMMMNWGWEEH